MKPKKEVLIIYRFLPQYRIKFYNGLKEALAKENIDLHLIYGKNNNSDALKNDEVDINWAKYIPNRTFNIFRFEVIIQPCLRYTRKKDLVIVEGANRLVLNYILMFLRHVSTYKLAMWGHGRNLQIKENSSRNKFKSIFLRSCDWYFAYTFNVKEFLTKERFNPKKITIVQNAIDTITLQQDYNNFEEKLILDFKEKYNLKSDNTGIYCGAMYPDKRMDYIINACLIIKKEIPDFSMIFLGSGIESHKVQDAAKQYDWIHYFGPKFNNERILYFKSSTLQLMPCAVGLAVLDSFAMETPLITTKHDNHGPEIEYLENQINGIITEDSTEIYAQTIIKTLKEKTYLNLIDNCKKSNSIYTMEKMIHNFKEGILKII